MTTNAIDAALSAPSTRRLSLAAAAVRLGVVLAPWALAALALRAAL